MKETKNQSILPNLLDCLDSLIKTRKENSKDGTRCKAVIHDMETDINMPFVLNVDKSGMLDMVAKQ